VRAARLTLWLRGWLWLRRWLKRPVESGFALLLLGAAALVLPGLVRWAVLDATWQGASRAACDAGGACWALITARIDLFTFGSYPPSERWRVFLALFWFLAIVLAAVWAPRRLFRPAPMALFVLPFFPGSVILMCGRVLGLPPVETRDWGGILLTVAMTIAAVSIAFPLALLLALGRQSKLPLLRSIAVAFIEFWRGVPILAVVFLASTLLPLVVPDGVTIDRLLRAIVGLALVGSAFMAEAIRAGLQAVPAAQAEAAQSLGLGYWRIQAFVVLPQALRIAMPGLVNELNGILKSTTLVLIVSLFEILGSVQAALSDPKWVGLSDEAYIFAGLVFWCLCFGVSCLGKSIERRLAVGGQRQ
jgi:general L-amino acid transport system permease protein